MKDEAGRILSFEDWAKSFEVSEPEERVSIATAAARLRKDQTFLRVIAEMERNALNAIRACPLKEKEMLFELKCVLHGVESVRRALRGIIASAEYEERKKLSRKE